MILTVPLWLNEVIVYYGAVLKNAATKPFGKHGHTWSFIVS